MSITQPAFSVSWMWWRWLNSASSSWSWVWTRSWRLRGSFKCIPAETCTKKIKPEMQPTDHMAVVAGLPCGYNKPHWCWHDVCLKLNNQRGLIDVGAAGAASSSWRPSRVILARGYKTVPGGSASAHAQLRAHTQISCSAENPCSRWLEICLEYVVNWARRLGG